MGIALESYLLFFLFDFFFCWRFLYYPKIDVFKILSKFFKQSFLISLSALITYATKVLTGLFAISGSSGKASGGIFGGFGLVFRTVFGQFSYRYFRKNRQKSF